MTHQGTTPCRSIAVLLPTFNDWESLPRLMSEVRNQLSSLGATPAFFIVNDCSTLPAPAQSIVGEYGGQLIHLTRNLGHQRAVAIGLAHILETSDADTVIVMDSDGEDRPQDIPTLIAAQRENRSRIVFAGRERRHESLLFRAFYLFYKALFRALTGKFISFGNFSAIPRELLKHLVHVSEIWNHYPGAVIRSGIPYATVPAERGTRYCGRSQMSFVKLIIHGISSLAVHLDIVSVRLLVATLCLMGLSLGGVVTVVAVRFGTTLAIPGWATYTVLAFVVIILQAFFLSLMLSLIVLFSRAQIAFIPLYEYRKYILKIDGSVDRAPGDHYELRGE